MTGVQLPLRHCVLLVQALLHRPQLTLELERSAHAVPHRFCPGGHGPLAKKEVEGIASSTPLGRFQKTLRRWGERRPLAHISTVNVCMPVLSSVVFATRSAAAWALPM